MNRAWNIAVVAACLLAGLPGRAQQGPLAIEDVRANALNYSKSLPDFVCTEVIKRFSPLRPGMWTLQDSLNLRLSYFGQIEEHKLELINGKPTMRTYDSVGGATGVGQFAGSLHTIFDPASAAVFQWRRSRTMQGRRVSEYRYQVEGKNSRFVLTYRVPGDSQRVTVGFHGVVEVDEATRVVVRFTLEADNIPRGFPITSSSTTVRYEHADVGGRMYLLPHDAETEMRGRVTARNVIEFREYRKFEAESKITFAPDKER